MKKQEELETRRIGELDARQCTAPTCRSATPMKIPATSVRLSCSHFSNWGTQPLTLMWSFCSESCTQYKHQIFMSWGFWSQQDWIMTCNNEAPHRLFPSFFATFRLLILGDNYLYPCLLNVVSTFNKCFCHDCCELIL